MDKFAFSLQCSHGLWRLLLQPVDDCTGQGSDGMAGASMRKHMGVEFNCIQLFADLYYTACGSGGFGPLGAVFPGHCTRHHPQSSPREGQILQQSQQQWELLGAQHRQVSCRKLKQASLQSEQR